MTARNALCLNVVEIFKALDCARCREQRDADRQADNPDRSIFDVGSIADGNEND